MEGQVIDLMREAITVMLKTAMPMLIVALVIGLVISIFQTATSIQEQTLAFVPKIICVFLSVIVFGSWMISLLTTFINKVFTSFNTFI